VSNTEGHITLKVEKTLKIFHPQISYAMGDTLEITKAA
jgi:hypothetical protein